MHLTTKIFTPKNSESNSDQKTCKSKKKNSFYERFWFLCAKILRNEIKPALVWKVGDFTVKENLFHNFLLVL